MYLYVLILKTEESEAKGQNMNLSNWSKGCIGIYHYLLCLKYLTIIIK